MTGPSLTKPPLVIGRFSESSTGANVPRVAAPPCGAGESWFAACCAEAALTKSAMERNHRAETFDPNVRSRGTLPFRLWKFTYRHHSNSWPLALSCGHGWTKNSELRLIANGWALCRVVAAHQDRTDRYNVLYVYRPVGRFSSQMRPIAQIVSLLMLSVAGALAAPPGPSSIAHQVEQARQAFETGDNVAVIEIAHRTLEHAESAELRNLLGKAYAHSGEPKEAQAELQLAIHLQPDNEGFRFDLGQFLLKSGDFGTAVTVLEDAHRRLPRSVQLELALGVAYYCTVRYDDAVRAFLKTMELAPDVPQPYIFLGKILVHADSYSREIVRECTVAERASPSNPYAPLLHAEVLIAGLRPNEKAGAAAAGKLLEKAIALKSDSAEAYFVLGCLMDREGDYPRAVQLLEKAVELKPDDPVARYRLGRLYVRLGKHEQADAEFAEQARLKEERRLQQ